MTGPSDTTMKTGVGPAVWGPTGGVTSPWSPTGGVATPWMGTVLVNTAVVKGRVAYWRWREIGRIVTAIVIKIGRTRRRVIEIGRINTAIGKIRRRLVEIGRIWGVEMRRSSVEIGRVWGGVKVGGVGRVGVGDGLGRVVAVQGGVCRGDGGVCREGGLEAGARGWGNVDKILKQRMFIKLIILNV